MENWFKEIREYSVDEVTCVAGKNPTPDKIQSFCMTCEGGKGCPNLVPQSYAELKPEEGFGRHNWKIKKNG